MNSLTKNFLNHGLILLCAGTLIHCGSNSATGDQNPNPEPKLVQEQTQEPKDTTAEISPNKEAAVIADEPKKFTEAEIMYLAGSNNDVNGAYSHCRDILGQGIRNKNSETLTNAAKFALKKEYCAMDEGTMSQEIAKLIVNKQQSANSSSGGSSRNGSVGYGLFSLGLEEDILKASNASQSSVEARSSAESIARSWQSSNCGNSSVDSNNSFAHTVLSSNIDPEIVEAWQACVAKNNNGFFCSTKENDDLVSITVKWMPNAVQKKLLPVLDLKLTAEHNLEALTEAIPLKLGSDSAKVVSFRKTNPDSISLVDFQGSDAGDQVSFACSIAIPKVVKAVFKEDPSCGVAFYNESAGAECGVARHNIGSGSICGVNRFKAGRSKVCGVESYKTARTNSCGVEKYKAKVHPSCPGTRPGNKFEVNSRSPRSGADAPGISCPSGTRQLSSDSKEATHHLVGPRGEGPSTVYVVWRKLKCERPAVTPSCRKPEFGVELYKSCAHNNHGVAKFNSCRNQSFGVEAYNTCRDPLFGVEAFNSCRHPLFGAAEYSKCYVEVE